MVGSSCLARISHIDEDERDVSLLFIMIYDQNYDTFEKHPVSTATFSPQLY